MFKCVCGFEGNSTHTKNCDLYKKEIQRVENNLKKYIKTLYLEKSSVSECVEIIKEKENTKLSLAKIRKIVDPVVIDLGIKKSLTDKDLNKKRQDKIKQTMLKRYGVVNNGQRAGHGWSNLNQINYEKLKLDTELNDFRKKVNYLTRKHVERLKRQNKIPDKCFYTGITFRDAYRQNVNPNDPYKRSVDHRMPVIEMFLKGSTPEDVCQEDNIVFCLRVVNTYKANTAEEYFIKEIVPYLIKRL